MRSRRFAGEVFRGSRVRWFAVACAAGLPRSLVYAGGVAQAASPASDCTAYAQTFANPDGTLTYVSSAVPRWVKQGSSWVSADATLMANKDGSLSPRAAEAPLTISGGGTGPLGRAGSGARPLAGFGSLERDPGSSVRGAIRCVVSELDLMAFDYLVAGARRGLARHRLDDAANALRDASRLWRGTAPLAGVRSSSFSPSAQLVERRLTMVEMHVDVRLWLGRHNELVSGLVDGGEASPAVSTAHSPRGPLPADGPRRGGFAPVERGRDCPPRRGNSASCPSRRNGFVICISGSLVRSTSHLVEGLYSFRTAASRPCWRCSSCRKETWYRSTGSLRGYGERIHPSPPRGRSIPASPLCGVSCENSVTTM